MEQTWNIYRPNRTGRTISMVTANALGLLGPISLLAVLGLNALLLWRASPAFARALGGTARPRLVVAFAPDGESNIIPFPAGRRAAFSPSRPEVRRAA
jgi:hypothetical protein